MAKNKEEKTNVMRTLEQKKIAYKAKTYPHGEGDPIDGVSVARAVGLDVEMVFKTLVCKGASGGYYVFDIPVAENLDLKKAARAVGEKSVAVIRLRSRHRKYSLSDTGIFHKFQMGVYIPLRQRECLFHCGPVSFQKFGELGKDIVAMYVYDLLRIRCVY